MSRVRVLEAVSMKHCALAAIVASPALLFTVTSAAGESTDHWPPPMHDNVVLSKIMLDRLELRDTDAGNLAYWEGQAGVGGDRLHHLGEDEDDVPGVSKGLNDAD